MLYVLILYTILLSSYSVYDGGMGDNQLMLVHRVLRARVQLLSLNRYHRYDQNHRGSEYDDNNHALSLLKTLEEKEAYLRNIEKNALMEYKVFPQFPHQDPHSPEYIYCELSDYTEKIQVAAYNQIIEQFRYDLALQRQVWREISKLDRPYKKGIRGIDQNLSPSGPVAVPMADIGFTRYDPLASESETFANQDAFIANTNWNNDVLTSNGIEFEKEMLSRPVTHDFNHAKGEKYDVPIDQKYEYLADRLGHPEFLGTPMDRLLRLEQDLFNPAFVDQPFVQTPTPGAHPSLNFEQGEVIYENTNVLEWCKFWQASVLSFIGVFALYFPLNIMYKTRAVPEWVREGLLGNVCEVNPYCIDSYRLIIPSSTCSAFYILYLNHRMVTEVANQYVAKASYSKDRELLFIKTIGPLGNMEESVFETAHLEILPPYQKSGVADMSMQDEDGLWRVTCLNSDKQLLFYNEDKYWNKTLKDPFLNNMLGMWDKTYYGSSRTEAEELFHQWYSQFEQSLDQKELPAK